MNAVENCGKNVIFEIKKIITNGCYSISDLSENPDEMEVLLDRASTFQVKSVENLSGHTDKWVIEMEISLIDLELVHEFQTMGTHFNTIYLH